MRMLTDWGAEEGGGLGGGEGEGEQGGEEEAVHTTPPAGRGFTVLTGCNPPPPPHYPASDLSTTFTPGENYLVGPACRACLQSTTADCISANRRITIASTQLMNSLNTTYNQGSEHNHNVAAPDRERRRSGQVNSAPSTLVNKHKHKHVIPIPKEYCSPECQVGIYSCLVTLEARLAPTGWR